MKTPEIRDRMSKISSPTIPFSSIIFSLIPFFSFSRRARGYELLLDRHSHIRRLSVTKSTLSLPSMHPQAFRPHCPIPAFFRFIQDASPSFMSSSEKASTMLGSVKGVQIARHISLPTFYPAASPSNVTLPRSQTPPGSGCFK